MLTDWARRSFKFLLDPIARALAWAHVSPNALTVFGTLLNIGVAYILSIGRFRLAGIAVLSLLC